MTIAQILLAIICPFILFFAIDAVADLEGFAHNNYVKVIREELPNNLIEIKEVAYEENNGVTVYDKTTKEIFSVKLFRDDIKTTPVYNKDGTRAIFSEK